MLQGRIREEGKGYGFVLLLFGLLLLVLILLAAIQQQAAGAAELSALTEREKILAFADHLFETGEYYRAITEYFRFLFFFPTDPMVGLVRLKIAYAYQRGAQWEDAGQQFETLCRDFKDQELGRQACFQAAETLRLSGNFRQAIIRYRQFIEAYPKDERIEQALFRIGCLHLELHEWLDAERAFSQVKSDSQLTPSAVFLSREARRLADLPLKKPALAATLSAIVPGAGQVYARRYRDGLAAFLVNGGFIWGVAEAFDQNQKGLGSILLVMELGWYAGNIYSAMNSSRKFNQQTLEKNLVSLRERCSLSFRIKEGMKGHNHRTEAEKYQLSFDFLF